MQAVYDALVERFVLPLVEGGEVQIGRPIAPGCASFFAQTVPSSEDARLRIFTALIDAADEIHDIDTVPWPSGPLVFLAAAAHNLCALTDPALDRLFVRGTRDTILAWVDRWIELVPVPLTRGDALARHALLAPILALRRTDTVLKTWAYTYRFHGRKMDLITLGEVRPTSSEVPLETLLEKIGEYDLVARRAALMSRSPVTELLSCVELPAFRFSLATLTVLADVGLRSGVAKALTQQEGAGAVITKALRAKEVVSHPPLLRIALAFVLELHMIAALDHPDKTRSTARSEDGMLFDALLGAAFEDDTAIETLRDLDDGDRAVLQRRVERVRPTLTEAQLLEASRLYRVG